MIELLGLLTGLGQLEFQSLIYPRLGSACCAVLFHKLKPDGVSGQIFGLILSFLSNRRLRVVLDGKFSQEYPVNAGFPQGSILGRTLYINDLPNDLSVILLPMLMLLLSALIVIRHLIYGNNQNWYLNLHLIYEKLGWGRKWFVGFNAVSFDRSNNTENFLTKNYLLTL